MWIYHQTTGELSNDAMPYMQPPTFKGYAGRAGGKNNPKMQWVKGVGPLPQGKYTIGDLDDSHATKLGPKVLALVPDAKNQMFGRSGFFIHGDEILHPGWASDGCMIFNRDVRLKIAASGDRDLTVVP